VRITPGAPNGAARYFLKSFDLTHAVGFQGGAVSDQDADLAADLTLWQRTMRVCKTIMEDGFGKAPSPHGT
jgi:hypothetical protein